MKATMMKVKKMMKKMTTFTKKEQRGLEVSHQIPSSIKESRL